MQSDASPPGAAATTESLPMHRSTSMPVKPKPLEQKPLLRSSEKETVNAADYYPESPGFVRRRRSKAVGDQLETRSEQNFPYTHDWAGSTIELTPDVGSGGGTSSSDGLRRSLHRVMEKNGKENVVFRRIPEKSWRYMRDAVTTLVRSWFGHKKTSSSEADPSRSDVYSITPSIQRRLDELANEPPHLSPHLTKTNPSQSDRVTFSI